MTEVKTMNTRSALLATGTAVAGLAAYAFVLRPRYLLAWIGHYVLLEPSHILMERKTLLGIKARAEAAVGTRRPDRLAIGRNP
jgi:hypothetical protein